MIKVLADKTLEFDRGEKDRDGHLITAKTTIGFCELPDWVAETEYFKLATIDGSIRAFESSADSEAVLKDQEKAAALKDEIAALEEKRDLLTSEVNPDKVAELKAEIDSLQEKRDSLAAELNQQPPKDPADEKGKDPEQKNAKTGKDKGKDKE